MAKRQFNSDPKYYLLEYISKAAIEGNIEKVRTLLEDGVNYRNAQMYVESFHRSDEASRLIFSQAHCECGQVAVKFLPEPLCPGCAFSKATKQIKYA